MTSASHAEGSEFDSRHPYFYARAACERKRRSISALQPGDLRWPCIILKYPTTMVSMLCLRMPYYMTFSEDLLLSACLEKSILSQGVSVH